MKLFLSLLMSILFSLPLKAEWQIQQKNMQIKEIFTLEKIYETYTGDSAIHKEETTPKNGHKFVLVEINIQNSDSTIPPFNANDFVLKTDKSSYKRIEDSFLRQYDIKPFTRLLIKKGNHSGFLLFEIPENELQQTPILLYKNKNIAEKK